MDLLIEEMTKRNMHGEMRKVALECELDELNGIIKIFKSNIENLEQNIKDLSEYSRKLKLKYPHVIS